MPKISVIMPVYNGELFLKEAIDSILNQSLNDFEFIIIDDGSTDNSRQIIEEYTDPRIKKIFNPSNLGLATSLNKAIEASSGEYLARMDCDDISLPARLYEQSKFLDQYQDISIVGTWAKIIGQNNKYYIKHPSCSEHIKANLLFHTSLVHPSVMIRKNDLDRYNLRYDDGLRSSQDYDLWVRTAEHLKLYNLKKVLLYYRRHDSQISQANNGHQKNNALNITLKLLAHLNLSPSPDEINLHLSLIHYKTIPSQNYLSDTKKWLEKIFQANSKARIYDNDSLSLVLLDKWLTACYLSSKLGFKAWTFFWDNPLSKSINTSHYKKLIKFFIKCLFKK